MEWHLEAKKLKRYPHFDSDITAAEAEVLAQNPETVASHSFYPFIRYIERWNKWAEKGLKGKSKERPIRYAARRDSYILSYYRYLLSARYEPILKNFDLGDVVLAYRRITDDQSGRGKCNIHFARDAFQKIISLGHCSVVALDISSYFESLDHTLLKAKWEMLLGVNRLPDDHYHVYRSITKYAFVDKMDVYERLGFYGDKIDPKSGRTNKGFLKSFTDIPRPQICSPAEFREKIAGGGSQKSIIQSHDKAFGIPQGSPISDLLANLYLLDFDKEMSAEARRLGGQYSRYSDDILIIIPGTGSDGEAAMKFAQNYITKYGKQIKIKDEKSYIYEFSPDSDGGLNFSRVLGNEGQGKNGLEYLGFRFDGKKIYIKDSTLSNLWRKVTRKAMKEAVVAAKRYPDKSSADIRKFINYEKLMKEFGRVEDFDDKSDDVRNWTFWTYASRAQEVFGDLGKPIAGQLKRHKLVIRNKVNEALDRAVLRRNSLK
jgi:Reverse transcriptase (RNA-dependent DNA polymerase)